MNQARFRRLARLEKRARAYIERSRRVNAEGHEFLRKVAFVTIANLVLIVLYGDPKIDEPLINAWDRVRKSAAWQECRKKHPDFGEYGREDEGDFGEYGREDGGDFGEYGPENRESLDEYWRGFFDKSTKRRIATPFDDLGAWFIAKYFRKYFLPELPGADETEKLNAVFRKAPPWLVWFCFGNMCGAVLGLEPPDLSSMKRFARGKITFYRLPLGPFECNPLPEGAKDEYSTKFEDDEMAQMTRRERKRTLRIMKNSG
jgi:hypothetical protein